MSRHVQRQLRDLVFCVTAAALLQGTARADPALDAAKAQIADVRSKMNAAKKLNAQGARELLHFAETAQCDAAVHQLQAIEDGLLLLATADLPRVAERSTGDPAVRSAREAAIHAAQQAARRLREGAKAWVSSNRGNPHHVREDILRNTFGHRIAEADADIATADHAVQTLATQTANAASELHQESKKRQDEYRDVHGRLTAAKQALVADDKTADDLLDQYNKLLKQYEDEVDPAKKDELDAKLDELDKKIGEANAKLGADLTEVSQRRDLDKDSYGKWRRAEGEETGGR